MMCVREKGDRKRRGMCVWGGMWPLRRARPPEAAAAAPEKWRGGGMVVGRAKHKEAGAEAAGMSGRRKKTLPVPPPRAPARQTRALPQPPQRCDLRYE